MKHPDPDCCTPSGKFPVFLLQDETDYWYGFPQFGYNGLKIGKFQRGGNAIPHPDHLDRNVTPEDEKVWKPFPLVSQIDAMFAITPNVIHMLGDGFPQP